MNIKYIIFALSFIVVSLNIISQDLIKAVKEGNVTLVETLLNNKPDMKIRDENERDLLSVVLMRMTDEMKDKESFQSPTLVPYKRIFTLLLQAGADVNAARKDNYIGMTVPLHLAINLADPELVQLLINHGADVNFQVGYGSNPKQETFTPLHSAVLSLCMVSMFSKHHEDERVRNYYDRMFEIIQLLVKAGAKKEAIMIEEQPDKTKKSMTPQKMLLDCMGAMPNESKQVLQRFVDLLKE